MVEHCYGGIDVSKDRLDVQVLPQGRCFSRATTTAVVHYAFDARLSSGPDAGTRYAGTLDLLGDTYGGLIGWLRLPGGTVYPVDGQQVNGNVNMLVIVRAGTPFFVVGTTGGSAYRGNLAGPPAADQGTCISAL